LKTPGKVMPGELVVQAPSKFPVSAWVLWFSWMWPGRLIEEASRDGDQSEYFTDEDIEQYKTSFAKRGALDYIYCNAIAIYPPILIAKKVWVFPKMPDFDDLGWGKIGLLG
jgi:hypothetical protein